MLPRPPTSTLFPYTTLFRSALVNQKHDERDFVMIGGDGVGDGLQQDRKSTRLNSSHRTISYAVFCLKKKKKHPTEKLHTELSYRKFYLLVVYCGLRLRHKRY